MILPEFAIIIFDTALLELGLKEVSRVPSELILAILLRVIHQTVDNAFTQPITILLSG